MKRGTSEMNGAVGGRVQRLVLTVLASNRPDVDLSETVVYNGPMTFRLAAHGRIARSIFA